MNLGNFIEYTATGGHPHAVPGWVDVLAWAILVLGAVTVVARSK